MIDIFSKAIVSAVVFSILKRTATYMISWICKYKKALLLLCHLVAVPGAVFLRYLSEKMLQTNTICPWLQLGAQCPTCGGTHFVNALLSGDILGALKYNAFLFVLALFFAGSVILLDLAVWCELSFAKKALKKLYTTKTPIVFGVLMVLFVILRNWHIWALLF